MGHDGNPFDIGSEATSHAGSGAEGSTCRPGEEDCGAGMYCDPATRKCTVPKW